MKKRETIILIKIIIFVAIIFLGYFFVDKFSVSESVKIANWNLKIFGEKKSNDVQLMNFYSEKIKNYDIVFIQEIRDKEEESFPKLCALLQNYSCKISSRAGTTSVKEQYGIIYKNGIEIISLKDYNPLERANFERPPIQVSFNIKNYSLIIYNIHTKPENTKSELENLERIVLDEGNVIIIGDLNADCSYYNNARENDFEIWEWILKDNEDTTSGASNCAYDRIILNSDAKKEFLSYGIDSEGITSDISDHYLVWVEMKI